MPITKEDIAVMFDGSPDALGVDPAIGYLMRKNDLAIAYVDNNKVGRMDGAIVAQFNPILEMLSFENTKRDDRKSYELAFHEFVTDHNAEPQPKTAWIGMGFFKSCSFRIMDGDDIQCIALAFDLKDMGH